MDLLKKCMLCPRNCAVNRYENVGVCGAGAKIKVAYYSLHEWEEPIISGDNGSGTVFFSHCNLKCLFCQNKKISALGYGKEISSERLKEIFLELQSKGAHNINLVTPTHFVPQIVEVLLHIKGRELKVPVVYNTSSYENVDTIRLLDGIVDVYLADLKYFSNDLSIKYSKVRDYFEKASQAILEMYEQVGNPVIEDNLLKRGIIVRILVLPGHVDDAKKMLEYLWNTYGDNIYISIMNQYTPIDNCLPYDNLNRKLFDEEYDEVIDFACDLGITNAFVQDGETAVESFIPNFDCSFV